MMVSARLSSASRRSTRRRKAAFSSANGSGNGAAFIGRQGLQGAFGPKLAPMYQVRRIEALAAKQGSYLAGLRAGVGFLKDAPLVFGGKLTALGFRFDLRIHLGR